MGVQQGWKNLRKDTRRWLRFAGWLVLVNLVLLGLVALFWLGTHLYGAEWTGFGDAFPSEEELDGQPLPVLVQMRPAPKNLWDWLDLLIVPVVIGAAGYLFSQAQRRSEQRSSQRREQVDREIAADRLQQATLEGYFDRMTNLVLERQLHGADPEDPEEKVQELARVRTLTVLLQLNGRRKGLVLRFLQELHLIQKDSPILSLRGADLSQAALGAANLPQAEFENVVITDVTLREADLRGTVLNGADLSGSILLRADLSGAKLQGAGLYKTNLERANLTGAELQGADLREANLQDAVLAGTNFRDADLTNAKLGRATYNRHTIWPDGSGPPQGTTLLTD